MKLLQQTQDRGIIKLDEWDNESMTSRRLRQLTTKFDKLVHSKPAHAAIDMNRRVLMQSFDQNADILIQPYFSGGGSQSFVEVLAGQSVAGSTFATYTTAKTVIPATNLITLPANWFYIGRSMKIAAQGAISNIVTTPGLMNFQVKIGSVAVFDTGNIQLNATAHTTLPFWIEIFVTCRAIGVTTSANLMGFSRVMGIMFTRTAGQTDDAQGMQTIIAPATNPAVGTGFDSTVANIVDFWVGFTISDAANLVRIDQYQVWGLN